LAVEQAERIALEPLTAIRAQLVDVRSAVRRQQRAIRRTTGGVAEGVEDQLGRRQSGGAQAIDEQHHYLGVRERIVAADDLGPELVELPRSALLRPLTTEHRTQVVELCDLIALRET